MAAHPSMALYDIYISENQFLKFVHHFFAKKMQVLSTALLWLCIWFVKGALRYGIVVLYAT